MGTAVNDLCLVSGDTIDIIWDFKVDCKPYSDHTPLNLFINNNTVSQEIVAPILSKLSWTKNDDKYFKEKLEKRVNSSKIDDAVGGAFYDSVEEIGKLYKHSSFTSVFTAEFVAIWPALKYIVTLPA
ncbi:hypothetical protein O3M35_004965 [Rhynocoris fuscipes]|uniref:Uncharacterized protein n=1 Tax=Rhynocoris fuscipes TaxID=488301 RepID=A0AAW1DHV7_9HEMI